MTYEFYITTASSVSYQVYPLNWLECSLVWEKENDEVFYRQKFEGSLTFGGKKLCVDFNLFYSFDDCDIIYLTIYKDSAIYWEGYLSTSMGEWDLDAQTFTVTPLVIDGYFNWENEGDREYDILSLSRVNTVYDDGGATTNYNRTILIVDVIQYLARQVFDPAMVWGVNIQSEFLTNATNPITSGTNHYNYLTISQKSDIIYPTSSNPATKGMMSFNGLMEILKSMNLRWEYDEDFNILTIEHISAWESVDTLDIRTEELSFSTNKYRYLTEEMPKYEKFSWMEAYNDDFVGETIWYDSNCVNQDPESNSTEFALNVTTDIQYIREVVAGGEPEKISKDGWVLFATYPVGLDYYIWMNNGIIEPGEAYFNADLSWGRLHNAFFKHGRVLIEGYMNGSLTTFYSARKTKQQECSIVYCSTFNPELNVTTELGETYFSGAKGDIKKAIIRPYGEINLTLNYGPPDNPVIPIPDQKIIRIVESGICGELHATLSPAADDDLVISFEYEVLDEDGIHYCDSGGIPQVWVIPNGSTDDDFTIVFNGIGCGGGIPAGGCWNPAVNSLDPEGKGWIVFTIIQDPDCSC